MPPVGYFDPWGLADVGSPETLAWYRAAELKHGRVCMAAFVGFLVQVNIGSMAEKRTEAIKRLSPPHPTLPPCPWCLI